MTIDPRAGEQSRWLAAGYEYQDVIAALAMARALLEGFRSVGVVVPMIEGDAFDDLVVVARDGGEDRTQVKHSDGVAALTEAEFRTASGRLPIDKLLASAAAASAATYRLVSNWSAPGVAERAGFLVPTEASRLDPALPTTLWRLDSDAIWPVGGDPRWSQFGQFTRNEFVTFCGHFVIELGAPGMSASLAAPGPLETHLIRFVRERLEVERHPNRRRAFDVAGQLVALATATRSRKTRTLARAEILHELQLIVDQAPLDEPFPIEPTQYVEPPAATLLADAAAQDGVVLLVGDPGAGKSWTLEGLVSELRKAGGIVARHYCFVRPGDPALAQRVELVTMSENLIAELREDERLGEVTLGFARDPDALAAFLPKAAAHLREARGESEAHDTNSESGSNGAMRAPQSRAAVPRIAIIVDGLDHVMRVGRERGPQDTDEFVATLAGLKLPAGTTLILGSQPGDFLEAFRAVGAREIRVPPFDAAKVETLLARVGVPLDGMPKDEGERLVDIVVRRSAGNPLYVRFLAQQILGAIADRHSIDEVLLSGDATPFGDLAAYYESLMGPEDTSARLIAERLAVIEFLVTPDELIAILPELGRPRVDAALKQLRPVLNESVAGVRVYHDSLRQVVLARLAREKRSLEPLLAPVISWLDSRGFYEDDRAYRYLLPSLRRAGRHRALLDHLAPDFVGLSVRSLHPQVAVEANVRVGVLSARELSDAPALARLSELRRNATSAYQDKLSDVTEYAATAIALRGPNLIAGRLVFEGRPSFEKWKGLRICALIDGAGGIAPWTEYLGLPGDPPRGYEGRKNDPDLDSLRGILRVRPKPRMTKNLAEWLVGDAARSQLWYVRGAAELYREVHGIDAQRELVEGVPSSEPRAAFALDLALAYQTSGNGESAREFARKAVADGLPLAQLYRAVMAGAPAAEVVARVPDPAELVPDLLKEYVDDPAPAEKFISAVLVHAMVGRDLAALRPMLAGAGWYRQWLRFVVDLGLARQGRIEIAAAFEELVRDAAPFTGTPRAVDLYRLHDTVATTIALGFKDATPQQRPEILSQLITLTRLLTTKLQNSPTGPFTIWSLLALVERHPQPDLIDAALATVSSRRVADLYEVHAETELRIARLEKLAGRPERAESHWRSAARYLAAYGFRKDITVFGLIDGLAALGRAGGDARKRALQMRRLADLALYHSDGSETHAAPGLWFTVFAEIDPVLATRTVAETLVHDARIPSDRDDRAFRDVLVHAPHDLDPLLLCLLWRTLPVHGQVRARLAAVQRLRAIDLARGDEALRELAAAAEGDTPHAEGIVAELVELAAAEGLSIDGMASIPHPSSSPQSTAPLMPAVEPPKPRTEGPFLPASPSPFELLLALRDARPNSYNAPIEAGAFAREFRGHVRRILGESGPAPLLVVLQEYLRRNHFFEGRDLAEVVASELESEHPTAAAEAYALAWCAGRRFADYFGDHDSELLAKASALDPDAVRKRLLDECAAVIDADEYSSGIARRIVEVLVELGDIAAATAAWDAAHDVIAYRLPDLGVEQDIFRVPDPETKVSLEEAYGSLVGAAAVHPVYDRRAAALGAIAELSERHVDVAVAGLRSLLSPDAALTDWTLALALITESAALGGVARNQLRDRLLALATPEAPFAVVTLASEILDADAARPLRTYIFSDPKVTESEIRHAIANDYDDRIKLLSSVWSDLPVVVAARYARARRADPSIDDIREEQAEVQSSRAASWVPPLAIHDWWRETLERALQEELWGLRATMARRGIWSRRRERELLELVLPDVKSTVARARSRILRPPVPLPELVVSTDGPVVTEARGSLAGWIRLGYWETQIHSDDRFSRGSAITVTSAVVLGEVPAPWRGAAHSRSWFTPPQSTDKPTDEPYLVEFGGQQDCTAWTPVLLPVARVLGAQTFAPRPFGLPLDLVDADGRPAISLRYWSMWPYDIEFGPRTPTLYGSGLWMRRDVFEGIAAAESATTKIVVETESLPRRSSD